MATTIPVLRKVRSCAALLGCLGLLGGAVSLEGGGLLREVFLDIPGTAISNLVNAPKYPFQPDATNQVSTFEAPANFGDDYGQRLRGYLGVPVTGSYVFWIASDEQSALYLSTNTSPADVVQIAGVNLYTAPREWTAFTSQRSTAILLEAGKLYYVEAQMKEGTGDDHLAVRWQWPDGTVEEPIPGTWLAPWGAPLVPPQITQQPANQTVAENQPAQFTVTVSNLDPMSYQWERGGVPLPGATAATLTLTAVSMGDNGAVFRCRVSNAQGTVFSANAQLTVQTDRDPPRVLAAQTSGTNLLTVVFSELLDPVTSVQPANYAISPTVAVQAVTLAGDGRSVQLQTAGFTSATPYRLTVTGVQDRAARPNTVTPPGNQIDFVASEFGQAEVGTLEPDATVTPVTGGFDVLAGGTGIGASADQLQFGYQIRTGDFDARVRVQGLSLSDLWAMAALMARETLATNSPFAATVATPSVAGVSFSSRLAKKTTTQSGSFPVNYPCTWLRLARTGDRFEGYAGCDGESWRFLGAVTNPMPRTILLGLATASRSAGTIVKAEFRDFTTEAFGTAIAPVVREPAGPSSRRTGLALTEIHYRPAPRPDGLDLEFVEVFNSLSRPEAVGGFRLSGSIEYTFPTNAVIPAGGYLVVARNPQAVQSVYGLQNVLGGYANSLGGRGGLVRLLNRWGAVLLEVSYSDQPPWPVSADGAGHSLVLNRPSLGEADPGAWAASWRVGGSPGAPDYRGPSPLNGVVINEFLAHTDDPQRDYVELYNAGTKEVDLGGAWLTTGSSNETFQIPGPLLIPPRGFAQFTQDQLGFALSSAGERILLWAADRSRVADGIRFGPQANGVSTGRSPDGAPEFQPLQVPTPGTPNAGLRISDIIINEIMYHPISGDSNDEYVELHNRGLQPVDLSYWQFVDGIEFTFPAGTILPTNGYLVVARSVDQVLTNHPTLSAARVVGNYAGELADGGERLALARPNDPAQPFENLVVVDEVTYGDGGHWGRWSDGGGSSLELVDPRADHRRPDHWADSDETAKAPWTLVEASGKLELGRIPTGWPMDSLFVLLMDEGECLIDDVEVIGSGGVRHLGNSSFEADASGWDAIGTHGLSALDSTEGYRSAKSFHLRASGRGSTDANNVRSWLIKAPVPGAYATLRARCRWLRGSPEILLRLRWNFLEAAGQMVVPKNLGTPGAPNSRSKANIGPALWDVQHYPILPALDEPVTVTARAQDPDGVTSVRLVYRVEGTEEGGQVPMRDDGTGGDALAGDGRFTAVLPAQATNNLVAFYVAANDGASPSVSTLFPVTAPKRECLVRWGEQDLPGSLPCYRIWMTQATLDDWSNRHPSINDPLGVTFVYGNYRVIYDASAMYSGSPFHWRNYNSPMGVNCNYALQLAPDNRFLGATDFVLNLPCNLGSDRSGTREQLFFWLADQMGRPSLYRRYVHLFVNGLRRGPIFEDAQQPNRDVMEEWYPEDETGELYKVEDWFEYDDVYSSFLNTDASLWNIIGSDGNKQRARYRWNWRKRALQGSAHDYSSLFLLVDALNAQSTEVYTRQVEARIDVEQWMRTLALRHMVGDWDSYGYKRGKNMYAFKPAQDRWRLFDWDISFGFGLGDGPTNDLFHVRWNNGTNDVVTERMYNHPPFRRAYLRTVAEALAGPFRLPTLTSWLDANRQVLENNGVTSYDRNAILDYVTKRTAYLESVLATNAALFAVTQGDGAVLSSRNLLELRGTAPLTARYLSFNGVPYPVTWTSVTGWTAQVPLQAGTNSIAVQGCEANTPVVRITAVYDGPADTPEQSLVISELLYHPAIDDTGFVEIYNRSSSVAFDLTGYRLQGAGFTFAPGTWVAPGGYLVVVSDRDAFTHAYGMGIPVAGVFAGRLKNDGETLRLLRPGEASDQEIAVDEMAYSDAPPWPALADGQGSSLQLIDPTQDNRRVANWAAVGGTASGSPGWQFASVTAPAAGSSFYLYLPSGGDVYLDDLALVEGTVPESGPNLLQNPGFEAPLPGGWTVSPLDPDTKVSTAQKHSGQSSLHLVSSYGGNILDPSLSQATSDLLPGRTYTLSFWYLPTLSGGGLTAGVLGTALEKTVSLVSVVLPPAATTPGGVNSVQAILSPFPNVWINELRPVGHPTTPDAAGDPDPWVEIYNGGTTAVDLSGCFLTEDLSAPTRWAFPSGSSIPAGGFKIVWLDGEPAEATATEWHASFRIPAQGGRVALFQSASPGPRLLDDFAYGTVPNGLLVGSYPDGDPLMRQALYTATPGAPNSLAVVPPQIFINEWMAANAYTIADPADQDFDDWIELYNAGTTEADLSGWWLSDNPAQPLNWQFPAGVVVPPGGFLLVWADNETEQNLPGLGLHAGFKLSQFGESIVLSTPEGRTVDSVTFGLQTSDLTEGRFPDGAGSGGVELSQPTPGKANVLVQSGPQITGILVSPTLVTLVWQTQPGRTYQVQFKDQLEETTWQALTGNLVATETSLQATDPAGPTLPARFYRVVQLD